MIFHLQKVAVSLICVCFAVFRPPAQEEKVHRRKRSLRFFTVSSGNNSNQVCFF